MNDVLHSEAIALLKRQANGSIPLIIADPPYGIGYHSNHYKGRNPHAPVANDWNFQIGAFLGECARVLVDGGALYLFCRWDVQPLWIPYIQGCGLKMPTVISWVKDNWSAGDLTGCFGNQYEQILFITKGRHKLRGKRWPNVWTFPRVPVKQMLHPTQKPVPLLERAINASSNPGDLVLDPFAGSGSTAEAARNAKRSWLLGDLDLRMVNISRARLGLSLLEDATMSDDPAPPVSLDIPTPEEWGIHPEEIAALVALLHNNVQSLVQLTLRLEDAA